MNFKERKYPIIFKCKLWSLMLIFWYHNHPPTWPIKRMLSFLTLLTLLSVSAFAILFLPPKKKGKTPKQFSKQRRILWKSPNSISILIHGTYSITLICCCLITKCLKTMSIGEKLLILMSILLIFQVCSSKYSVLCYIRGKVVYIWTSQTLSVIESA